MTVLEIVAVPSTVRWLRNDQPACSANNVTVQYLQVSKREAKNSGRQMRGNSQISGLLYVADEGTAVRIEYLNGDLGTCSRYPAWGDQGREFEGIPVQPSKQGTA